MIVVSYLAASVAFSGNKELGAHALITSHVPMLTREEKKIALLNAISILNSQGITSFTDAAIGPGGDPRHYVIHGDFISAEACR